MIQRCLFGVRCKAHRHNSLSGVVFDASSCAIERAEADAEGSLAQLR